MAMAMLGLGLGATAPPTADYTPSLADVNFALDSSAIDAGAVEQLRPVVAWAHDHPWRLLVIEGYADHLGGRSANLTLSQDRAEAIRGALLELGLAPDRLVVAAYGEDAPAAGRHVVVRGTVDDFRELLQPAAPPKAPPPAQQPSS